MKYIIKDDIDDIDIKKWSSFIFNHEHGNIFQTPEFYQVYFDTPLHEPIILSVYDKNDNILGILLVVIQKVINNKLGYFSSRAIIHGGPIVKNDDPKILDLLLRHYLKKVKNKVIVSQIRNMREWGKLKIIFLNNGFIFDEHLNILVDLKKSEDILWKEVHSKRRNEIRRSIKKGTSFLSENRPDLLQESYNILVSVYKRAKLPLPPYLFFENLFNCSKENFGIKIFCASNENNIIGCLIALVYKDTIYDYYAGSYREYYNKYPNDLIPWEIFKWSRKHNYKTFDFGGAGKPNVPYGVREYKKKFGGKFVQFGRYEKIHKPVLYNFVKFFFKLWQKIK